MGIQLVLFTSKCMRPTTYTHIHTLPNTHTYTHTNTRFPLKMDCRNTYTRNPSSMGSRNTHTYTTVHHTHKHTFTLHWIILDSDYKYINLYFSHTHASHTTWLAE